MSANSQTLRFSISGETITDTYRSVVLEGRWREAVQDLRECLVSDEITPEVIEDILAGRKALVGTSEEGLSLVEDDTEKAKRHRDELDDVFGGCVVLNKRLYKPRSVVTNYGPMDRRLQLGNDPREDFIREAFHDRPSDLDTASLLERAKTYSNAGDCITMFCAIKGRPKSAGPRNLVVIFEPAPDLPAWIRPCRNAQEAVDTSTNLRFVGHDTEYAPMTDWLGENMSPAKARNFEEAHNQAWGIEDDAPGYPDLTEAILRQNAEMGYGLRDAYFGDQMGIRQIPIAPLLKWALDRFNKYEDSKLAVPEWKPLNPSGIKMMYDDPSHTDWMMAAGILDADPRAIDPYIDQLLADVQNEALGLRITVLVGGRDYACGAIKFCKADTEVDHETIAVIPHAGEDFMNIARRAAAVITLKGGGMSHLAVNGLAEGFLIIRDEKAKRKFEDGNWVEINAKAGTLTLISEVKPSFTLGGL